MKNSSSRAEIIVRGLVQGVGFRSFVLNKAKELKLNGYVKNLIDGTVFTIVEGRKSNIQILYDYLKVGPMYSDVRDIKISWNSYRAEFASFEIRRY